MSRDFRSLVETLRAAQIIEADQGEFFDLPIAAGPCRPPVELRSGGRDRLASLFGPSISLLRRGAP